MAFLDVALVLTLVAAIASGRVPAGAAFLAFILSVAVTERLPFPNVMELLADPSLVAVVCLVLFSSVIARMAWIRRLLFARGGYRLDGVLARFLGVTALVSSVTPNTAVVGAFMGPAANHPRISPHQLLMPLSYMALTAGMLTPFGTSANLIVVGQASRAGIELTPIDFLLPGLAAVGAVFVTLLFITPRFLKPPRGSEDVEQEFFHVEATIPPGSPLAGQSVLENRLRNLGRFFLAEVMRGERVLSPVEPTEVLREGDVLVFVGDVRYLEELSLINGLVISAKTTNGRQHDNILHAVVSANSSLEGATLKEIGFRSRFDASVFAIRRGNERLSGKLGQQKLKAGDLLVFAAGHDFAAREDIRGQLHVVETDHSGNPDFDTRSTLAVSAGFLVFLVLAFTGLVPFALAALLLLGFVMAGGYLTVREIKRNFPFELVIVLWGSLVLGALIAQSGLATTIAETLLTVAPGITPVMALILVFITTWFLTELLSNVSAALVALPIGLEVARLVGVGPEPFALIVAFGASASFLVPFGYQTHLMVMTPGSYSFADFTRVGSVVLLAFAVGCLTAVSVIHF